MQIKFEGRAIDLQRIEESGRGPFDLEFRFETGLIARAEADALMRCIRHGVMIKIADGARHVADVRGYALSFTGGVINGDAVTVEVRACAYAADGWSNRVPEPVAVIAKRGEVRRMAAGSVIYNRGSVFEYCEEAPATKAGIQRPAGYNAKSAPEECTGCGGAFHPASLTLDGALCRACRPPERGDVRPIADQYEALHAGAVKLGRTLW